MVPASPGRALTVLCAAVYVVAVGALTMLPHRLPGGGSAPLRSLLNVVPLRGADQPTFALNIVMTVPLGLLLPLLVRVRGVAAVALVGLVVSSGIELTQGVGDLLVGLGRTVDVNDVIANTTGAVVGLLVYRVVAGLTGRGIAWFALPGSTAGGPAGGPAPAGPGAGTATRTATRTAARPNAR